MRHQISTSNNTLENDTILEEHKKQSKLQKALDSFIDGELLAAKVIECEYISDTEIEYNSETYEISGDKSLNQGAIVYLPVFVLDYNEINETITSGWYSKKKDAINKRDKLKDNDVFRMNIYSESKIISHSSKYKLFENIELDIFDKTKIIDIELTLILSCTIAMFILSSSLSIKIIQNIRPLVQI
jgi:hypothetical protein